MNKLTLFLSLALCNVSSWGDCEKLIADIAKELHPHTKPSGNVGIACKVWPYAPEMTIVAIPFPSKAPNQEEGYTIYDLEVAIIDSASKKIISHYYEKQAFGDDAVFTDNMTIDTGLYRLSPTARAFGIRFHKRNFSTYNAFRMEILNLYYLQEKNLRLALRGLSVQESYSDWDNSCMGTFRNIQRTLVMEKNRHSAFNYLKLNEVTTDSALEAIKIDKNGEKSDCEEMVKKVSKNSQLLKHNGISYVIPKNLMGIDF